VLLELGFALLQLAECLIHPCKQLESLNHMVVNKPPEHLPSPPQNLHFDLVVFSNTYSGEA
jgi:hypothetical protein